MTEKRKLFLRAREDIRPVPRAQPVRDAAAEAQSRADADPCSPRDAQAHTAA